MVANTRLGKRQERNELKRKGFIHITGLIVFDVLDPEDEGEEIRTDFPSKWNFDGEWTVAVTEDKEVWLLSGEPDKEIKNIFKKLEIRGPCPGCVPILGPKSISFRQLAARVRNSECSPW